MSTVSWHPATHIGRNNPQFSPLRTTVETAFYANHMTPLTDIAQAYELAKAAPGTIVLDRPVKNARELGLPEDAKILVENGGRVTGRTAAARRLWGTEEDKTLLAIVRDVIHNNSLRSFYKTTAFVGLDESFMIRAHLALPKEEVNNLYSWLLNFQWASPDYEARYQASRNFDEADIYLYADPQWSHPDYPMGLAYFDPAANVAIVLGMQYFGELKKGTLTLAWTIAHRHNFVSCHGGLKSFILPDATYVASFFGLSGTGKSTLTHAKHNDKYGIKVLHDDAFVVDIETLQSVALEPSYFDKTQDYPYGHPEQDYFVTVQNVGVTLDPEGHKVIVTEDIRNGNGRTVKSRFSTPNRVDKFNDPINAVFWLMKDDALPPVLKIDKADLATIFGLTLATKRSTAENVAAGTNLNQLVIEPFANPFRVYHLAEDCASFEALFASGDVDCYILNTGFFLDKKVTAPVTLSILEAIVEKTAQFQNFGPLPDLYYLPIDGYEVDFDNPDYVALIKDRLYFRKHWIEIFNQEHTDKLSMHYVVALDKLLTSLD
ncbi:TPA: phosphoenolpyruvate carboxykinase (ATP) [Streptococcus suis]